MSTKYIIFCFALSLQNQLISTLDSCQANTCQECISDPNICIWCAANDFNGTRCIPKNSYKEGWCTQLPQNPENKYNIPKPKEFSSVSEQVVQIKPQQYQMKLRPGMKQQFNFSFKAAQDYPVDLYFLLDASKTMNNIREMTAKRGEDIYLAIKDMTKNVHLGFGTFIDKNVLPISTPNKNDSELSYSFRHRLKLVDDFNQFKKVVSETPTGVSRDDQEGGLDALAQVLVCKQIIGWRNESRKIVVFLTDGPYHAAGDGKSAGLFQPYDGKCYTEKNTYTKELEMDYPSVGIINKLAAEHDVIVIFVVDYRMLYIYKELNRAVRGSQVTSFDRKKMNDKSSNDDEIVTILKDIYEKISKKVKLVVKVKSGNKKLLKINFDPDCTTDTINPGCDIEIGKAKPIVGTVLYNDTKRAVIEITVEGIGEKLTLEIDPIKNCDCEREVELTSEYCHGSKRLCGQCSCNENRNGIRCQCVKSENNDFKDNSTCIAVGSNEICSNHGSCICGTCKCDEKHTGKFCECNMESCPRGASTEVCSGTEHGVCDCGKCKCTDNWSGDACDCYKPDTYCKAFDSNSICNNRGQCKCGKCQCEDPAEWDARSNQTDRCQISPCTDPHCHERQCEKLVECAKCRRSGLDECTSCKDGVTVQVIESLTEEHINSSLWNVCSNVKVEISCQTSFVYRYDDSNYTVEVIVANKSDCAPKYYLFGGIFLVTLLLVGAGTLIAWKLLTDARDRHEYIKFLQQNKLDPSGPSDNPLYEPPTTTFNNPAFRKKSNDFR